MGFHLKDDKIISVVLLLILHLFVFNLSGGQKVSEKDWNNSSFPLCSLDLFELFKPQELLYRINLDGSAHNQLNCEHKKYSNVFFNVTCESTRIYVDTDTGFEGTKIGVRISCFDIHPLQYDQDHALPFAGIESVFDKYILPDDRLLHGISITFPRIKSAVEGLEVYSGIYHFSRTEPKWDLQLDLSFSSTNDNQTQKKKEMCIKIFDDRMDCEVGLSNSDVYFVNVGGENPTETHLLKPCLNSSVKNACGNKYPGTNCLQSRYCKKINQIHAHGLARCSADNVTKDVEYFRDIFADIHINMDDMWNENLLIRIEEENNDTNLEIEYEDAQLPTSSVHQNNTPYCSPPLTVLPVKPQGNMTLYTDDFYNLECHFIPYFLVKPVVWLIGWNTGDETKIKEDYGESFTDEIKFVSEQEEIQVKIKSSHLKFQASRDMAYISCEMWYWNSSHKAKNIKHVHVKESHVPLFSPNREIHSVESGETLTLKCDEPNARPQPNYLWAFKEQEIGQTSELSIPHIGTSGSGQYTCTASNFKGKDSKIFDVRVNDAVRNLWVGLGLGFVAFAILLSFLLAALYHKYLKTRAKLTTTEIKEFINGNAAEVKKNNYAHVNARHMAYNKDYELNWHQFKLSEQELGSGVHGVVYRGSIGELPIAVKTVREGVEKQVLKALLDEIKIMIYLEKHDHIVDFKGACTQFLDEGRVYVIVEFCKLGSLESFLHDNRTMFCLDHDTNYVNAAASKTIASSEQKLTIKHLLLWSVQIAEGMRYLEEKKVIHGDLAVRNVLMVSVNHVKITDFGLSKQLINTDTYVKTNPALLPWRYMAIEALKELRFTSKSDVWSYGVTVWEIFSLGTTPYRGMHWTIDFVQFLEDNMRLYKPKYATDAIYKILTNCWAPEPESRPSFSELQGLMLNVI